MRLNYQQWSEADVERLRQLVAEKRYAPQIAKALGRSVTSIRNKMQALDLHIVAKRADEITDAERWDALREKAAEEVQRKKDLYEWLRPVEMAAPARKAVTSEPSHFTLVAGDMHFGMQDDRACAVFLAAVEAIRPRRVILNGDTVDLLAVSHYPKDYRKGKTWQMRDEQAAFHSFLHTLHSIGDGWGLEVIETSANHSGNGTDGRWWRYLNDRCPELLQHSEAEELLSYQRWWFPKWSTIRIEDSFMLGDDLLVMHGDIVRGEAGYTAKASREKWMNSVLVNHTHRMGLSPKTITAHAGRPTSYVRGYENGCLCKLEVPYGRALNWQQGFGIVGEGAGSFSVEQVFIDNGKADIATLGKTLRA